MRLRFLKCELLSPTYKNANTQKQRHTAENKIADDDEEDRDEGALVDAQSLLMLVKFECELSLKKEFSSRASNIKEGCSFCKRKFERFCSNCGLNSRERTCKRRYARA